MNTARNSSLVVALAAAVAPLAPAASAAPSDSFEGEVEYVVPVSKTNLKPFAKFFVSRFSVSKDEFSGFTLRLSLPRDLTGGKTIDVELVETGRQGNTIKFTKDIGDAECSVPADWSTAKCVYRFNDNFREQVPKADASAFLSKKYKGDPSLAARKEVVLDVFLSTESIGEANLRRFDAACSGCRTGNGVWDSTYTTATGQEVRNELSLERGAGTYFHDAGAGRILNVTYQGNTATGTWIYGGAQGWFVFTFTDDGVSFDGSWGQGTPLGVSPKGNWNGTRLQD